MSDKVKAGPGAGRRDGGNGGNGRSAERRTGVDRRIADAPGYPGPDRRKASRRRPERLPDKPIKR